MYVQTHLICMIKLAIRKRARRPAMHTSAGVSCLKYISLLYNMHCVTMVCMVLFAAIDNRCRDPAEGVFVLRVHAMAVRVCYDGV